MPTQSTSATCRVLPLLRPIPRAPIPSLARIADRLREHAQEILDDEATTIREANDALRFLGIARDIATRPRIVRFIEQIGASR